MSIYVMSNDDVVMMVMAIYDVMVLSDGVMAVYDMMVRVG